MTLRSKLFLSFMTFAMVPIVILGAFAFLDARAVQFVSETLEEDSRGREVLQAQAGSTEFESGEAFISTNQLVQRLLYLTVFVGISVFFVSFFLADSITRPIKRLSFAVNRMKKGNYAARADVRAKGEIGMFATTFNRMAEKIEKSHAGLEDEVRKRTRELHEAKVRDEQILASIGEGIVFVDPSGRVKMVNGAAERMLACRADAMLGKSWAKVTKPRDGKGKAVRKDRLPYQRALATGRTHVTTVPGETLYFARAEDDRFPVALTASPVEIEGEMIGAIIVFRDMTMEKHVDDSKSEFVSLASHQLRTPLTAMRLFTELLISGKSGKLSGEQKEYLYYLQHAVVRMSRLVNDLLNISRIETGRLRIDPKPTNLVKFVQDIIHDVEIVAEKKGLKFAFRSSPKTKIMLDVDPDLLYQAVNNLLTNAIRYSAKTRPRVTITLEKQRDGSVLLAVKDNGIGIRKGDRDKVFTKFYRSDAARKKEPEGSGLGLYLTKTILDEAGGKIWFEANAGKGTTFFIRLTAEGMRQKAGEKSLNMEIA